MDIFNKVGEDNLGNSCLRDYTFEVLQEDMLGSPPLSHLVSYISGRGWLVYKFDSRFLQSNLWYEPGNMAKF